MRARHLVFVDEASLALLRLLERVAPSDAAVHISGETGTGKELVARQIHQMSGRSGPFAAVNCGAINEHLAESELFGHEAGSFTGANARREGWFEAANGGTLFLDEIGDLPLRLQGKLLRVLQEGEVSRVGSRRSTPVNVRIISATNADLAALIRDGRFREDLLFRLNVVNLKIPPLPPETSGKTFSIGCTSSRYACCPCGSAWTTSTHSPSISFSYTASGSNARRRGFSEERSKRCGDIHGPETSASWKTSSTSPC